MKVVIIEDEKITARDLQRTILAITPTAEIVATLHSVATAIQFFKTPVSVDLIFADIQLTDGVSFNIFSEVEIKAPIIFCTAFNNYYHEAFNNMGIDYLLKPFSKLTVENALLKYQNLKNTFLNTQPQLITAITTLNESTNNNKTNTVFARERDKIIPLTSENVAIIYIENGNTYAVTFTKERYNVTHSLDELETIFGPTFFRANRQFIINKQAVKDANNFKNRKLLVNLNIAFDEQIIIGKLKITNFLSWLAKA
jgi:two-component system, LytTR family, response regulator LytT